MHIHGQIFTHKYPHIDGHMNKYTHMDMHVQMCRCVQICTYIGHKQEFAHKVIHTDAHTQTYTDIHIQIDIQAHIPPTFTPVLLLRSNHPRGSSCCLSGVSESNFPKSVKWGSRNPGTPRFVAITQRELREWTLPLLFHLSQAGLPGLLSAQSYAQGLQFCKGLGGGQPLALNSCSLQLDLPSL